MDFQVSSMGELPASLPPQQPLNPSSFEMEDRNNPGVDGVMKDRFPSLDLE